MQATNRYLIDECDRALHLLDENKLQKKLRPALIRTIAEVLKHYSNVSSRGFNCDIKPTMDLLIAQAKSGCKKTDTRANAPPTKWGLPQREVILNKQELLLKCQRFANYFSAQKEKLK